MAASSRATPGDDDRLSIEETRAILDDYGIEYEVHSSPVNDYIPTRKELMAYIQHGQTLETSDVSAPELLPLPLFQATDVAQWQRHRCRVDDWFFLEGQTYSRLVNGGLYFLRHRRETARARHPGPTTYVILEGPEGRLSNRQSLLDGLQAYTRYTISVAYDIDYCLATLCVTQEKDVEGSCVFNID